MLGCTVVYFVRACRLAAAWAATGSSRTNRDATCVAVHRYCGQGEHVRRGKPPNRQRCVGGLRHGRQIWYAINRTRQPSLLPSSPSPSLLTEQRSPSPSLLTEQRSPSPSLDRSLPSQMQLVAFPWPLPAIPNAAHRLPAIPPKCSPLPSPDHSIPPKAHHLPAIPPNCSPSPSPDRSLRFQFVPPFPLLPSTPFEALCLSGVYVSLCVHVCARACRREAHADNHPRAAIQCQRLRDRHTLVHR